MESDASPATSEPSTPELDSLKRYIAGMSRAWEHDIKHLVQNAELGGADAQLLQDVVQDAHWRAMHYGEACAVLLGDQNGIAFLPVIRSLYETFLALSFLADRSEADRVREAKVAVVHPLFYTLWQIRTNRRLDDDGSIAAEVHANIDDFRSTVSDEVLAVAASRESKHSWTGMHASELIAKYDARSSKVFYSNLSNLGHGHNKLIARRVMRWKAETYVEQAAHTLLRMKQIRRLMQDLLFLRFSDPDIDEFGKGDTMLVRYPHATIRTVRP